MIATRTNFQRSFRGDGWGNLLWEKGKFIGLKTQTLNHRVAQFKMQMSKIYTIYTIKSQKEVWPR